MPTEIKRSIKDALELAKVEDSEAIVATFNFPVPRDSHLIPLFERALFEQLVSFHNANDTQSRHVDLFDLMSLDPELPKLTTDDQKIRGELMSEHELAHEFANIDKHEYPEHGIDGRIIYDLEWKNIDNRMVLKTNARLLYIPEDESIERKIDISLAARYPSQSDIHDLTVRHSSKEGEEDDDRIKIYSAMVAKARETGGNNLGTVILHGEMLRKIFSKWKTLRQTKIVFQSWWN